MKNAMLGLIALIGSTYAISCQAFEHAEGPATPPSVDNSQSCMYRLWKRLLPVIDKQHGYLTVDDIERVTGVTMQEHTSLGPKDTISSYEMSGPSALAAQHNADFPLNGQATLSIRVEIHKEPQPTHPPLTWQYFQGRTGGATASVVDLSCFDVGGSLTLREAESDLTSLGFRHFGTGALPGPDLFYRAWHEEVDLYYNPPGPTAQEVLSIHIIGVKRAH